MELRDSRTARQFLAQSLWLQRGHPPTANHVKPILEWALEIVASGHGLPPLGFVADLGHLLLDQRPDSTPSPDATLGTTLPSGLTRAYEDLVLGKCLTDGTLERASAAIRRYQGRDRARGVAYVVGQFMDRAGLTGVLLSPAVIKASLGVAPQDLLQQGWEEIVQGGIMPDIVRLTEDLIARTRRLGEILASEDIFELEHGTALSELGQRVALRQVLQTARRFESALAHFKPRPRGVERDLPTRLLDEDTYPVGGFASISTRGSIESLLHSQLAFMETESASRPDLFDIKFLRDELLYYSRDENRLLRRRRTFVFVLEPDLTQARFKDPELPTQRIVMLLALIVTWVRQLTKWLSDEALVFEILLPRTDNESAKDPPLKQELDLLKLIFREPIAHGTVILRSLPDRESIEPILREARRRSLCHVLHAASLAQPLRLEGESVDELVVDAAVPRLADLVEPSANLDADPWESWEKIVKQVPERWL